MLILLPPSESKSQARRGSPLRWESLSFPELTSARRLVADAVADVSAGAAAFDVLGVPATLADEVARNTRLQQAPTLRAIDCYDGVLYDALDVDEMDTAAKRRAARRLVVVSALYGALRPGDRIAAYRLSMSVTLPSIGPLARLWRGHLDAPLTAAAGRGLVVDCRSSTYVSAWRPRADLARRWVQIRVPGATHMAKHTRGLVAATLCRSAADPRSIDGLIEVLAADHRVVAAESPATGPHILDVLPD